MKEMFNNTLSTLEIWFFDESRMIPGYTSLIHDGKDLSLCTRLQALDLISYNTRMARTSKFTEGASLPCSQYLITSFRLESWVTQGALHSYFQYNVVLLVYDWCYTQVCSSGLAPFFFSNILLVFDLYTMLLKGPRSHAKKLTSSRLVLHMFDYFDYSS
jgi:hypothetical protein